jgi:hypothetical protein
VSPATRKSGVSPSDHSNVPGDFASNLEKAKGAPGCLARAVIFSSLRGAGWMLLEMERTGTAVNLEKLMVG